MSAVVQFRLANGAVVALGEGTTLGRARTADLRFDDPSVSEMHALISLREGEVRILALRGRVEVNGVAVDEAALVPGLWIELTQNTSLSVLSVHPEGEPVPATVERGPRPVQLVCRQSAATVTHRGEDPLRLGGQPAYLLWILAGEADAVTWEYLARHLWPERDRDQWRSRFDAMLKDLRERLADHGLRTDLVWSWRGAYRLNLRPGDSLDRA